MTSMPQTCCKVEEGMLTAGMQEHAETILPLTLHASLFRNHTHGMATKQQATHGVGSVASSRDESN